MQIKRSGIFEFKLTVTERFFLRGFEQIFIKLWRLTEAFSGGTLLMKLAGLQDIELPDQKN
jgi:hypothetical protein